MTNAFAISIRSAALAVALALAACGSQSDEAKLANLDNQIVGNDTDPALTSALEDQIMVDPTLTSQSNKNAVRPPETPLQAQYPAGSSGRGAASSGPGVAAGCGPDFDHNMAWANRLPAAFAIYPGSRITEAAASREGDCRVVTFTTGDAPDRVRAFYAGQAGRSGYTAEHQVRDRDHILAGTNGRSGAAFYLIITPLARGSDVALIADRGR